MSSYTTNHKKRITITINPSLYQEARSLQEPMSRILEKALTDYLKNQKKEQIKQNLLKRSQDKECQKEDLELAQAFFEAEI